MRSLNRQLPTKCNVEALPAAGRGTVYWQTANSPGSASTCNPPDQGLQRPHTGEGKVQAVTMGRHALWTAEDARAEASRLIADIKGGNAASRPGADAPPSSPCPTPRWHPADFPPVEAATAYT